MIGIAHEVPEKMISFVQERTDLDFAIAHFAKQSKVYIQAYRDRAPDRLLIMDNGKFELGTPLSRKEVAKAAEAVRADYVIPPDFIRERERSLKALVEWIRDYGKVAKIAPVIVGGTAWDMVHGYRTYTKIAEVAMYCFSFLSPRFEALSYLRRELDTTRPYHLLGFQDPNELTACLEILKGCRVTIDTMKPVSAAYCSMQLTNVGRGVYVRPSLQANRVDKRLLASNIAIFREWVQRAEGEANGNKELA